MAAVTSVESREGKHSIVAPSGWSTTNGAWYFTLHDVFVQLKDGGRCRVVNVCERFLAVSSLKYLGICRKAKVKDSYIAFM